MSHFRSWCGAILALAFGSWTFAVQAQEFRYHYVSLDDKAPPGFAFFNPAGINDSGRVSGTVYNCDDFSCFDNHVAIYENGAVTVRQPGDGGLINAGGTVAGDVVLDPINFITQAALFRNKVELVPRQ